MALAAATFSGFLPLDTSPLIFEEVLRRRCAEVGYTSGHQNHKLQLRKGQWKKVYALRCKIHEYSRHSPRHERWQGIPRATTHETASMRTLWKSGLQAGKKEKGPRKRNWGIAVEDKAVNPSAIIEEDQNDGQEESGIANEDEGEDFFDDPNWWEMEEYKGLNLSQYREKRDQQWWRTEPEFRGKTWNEVVEIMRMRDWEAGWAPWEEILSPEAQFAKESLATGEEEPLLSRDAVRNLTINEREQHAKEMADEEEKERLAEETSGTEGEDEEEEEDQLPLMFGVRPPRTWPPPGWHVDPDELAYIHGGEDVIPRSVSEADKAAIRATVDELKARQQDEEEPRELDAEELEKGYPRWMMFVKQYKEWVAANKEKLDEEAMEVDPEYYPGRRRVGEDYMEGMYELPFVEVGQHYRGVITTVHLYEGAFVNFGCVHDGWVAIRQNDWWHLRDIIHVGALVHVEVMAKRDPYRFRFPVELRFVFPNIDKYLFRRFDYPPIFGRPGDDNVEEVARDAGRPLMPRIRPDEEVNPYIVPGNLLKDFHEHPGFDEVKFRNDAEQALLDYEDDEAAIARGEELPDRDYLTEEEAAANPLDVPVEHVVMDLEKLDLAAARAEREEFKRLEQEAQDQGVVFQPPQTRIIRRFWELQKMHDVRQLAQREAIQRDVAVRKELGLPLEQPGRYEDESYFGDLGYDPSKPEYRNDYWKYTPPEEKKDAVDVKVAETPSAEGDVVAEWDEEVPEVRSADWSTESGAEQAGDDLPTGSKLDGTQLL